MGCDSSTIFGEIHERIVFMQKGMKKALRPYFELTNAISVGDLELFRNVADNISYSHISLKDVAEKLRVKFENHLPIFESIVAKAIRDGAIDATIDHANGWMVSKETGDVYSTNEPQFAFNSRIAFCLNMHNEAVCSLRFLPNNQKKEKESVEKRRERDYNSGELAKHTLRRVMTIFSHLGLCHHLDVSFSHLICTSLICGEDALFLWINYYDGITLFAVFMLV
ncbi:hypothetical protein IFM89_022488 [Coptis chinensis]|uniref:PCI domain-containing protein n=1 Tax=Coptis chinensis TaxID=261450 RepID=A0A835ICD3_9MAGN|nr:hypothetical protein IFM89_022488 [Coptis chinensis]